MAELQIFREGRRRLSWVRYPKRGAGILQTGLKCEIKLDNSPFTKYIRNMQINPISLPEIKIGSKISGGRVEKYYATVEKVESDGITVCYNGDVKSVKLTPNLYEGAGITK